MDGHRRQIVYAPRIEVGSIFRSPRSFLPLRPGGSSRMIEASQLETAVAAGRNYLPPAGPRGEKDQKPKSGAPFQIRVRTDINQYMATRTRSHSNGLIYGYT